MLSSTKTQKATLLHSEWTSLADYGILESQKKISWSTLTKEVMSKCIFIASTHIDGSLKTLF